MNGAAARGDRSWRARATSSLPVPVSPVTRTVASGDRSALYQLRDSRAEDVRLHGLREKVVSAQMHGSHGALDRAVPADHEHRNRLAPDPQRLDELDAVDAGHA
jgi:hypothetical protein